MTTLLTIAELLAGEALISPGGPVDRVTAMGEEPALWQTPAPHRPAPEAQAPAGAEAVLVTA